MRECVGVRASRAGGQAHGGQSSTRTVLRHLFEGEGRHVALGERAGTGHGDAEGRDDGDCVGGGVAVSDCRRV